MTQPVQIGAEGELLPGTSYRLLKRLGGGGMGSVYIAEHTALGRRDAVKLLAPHIAEDEQAMKRLEREARATAALANPHIIDIYTLGLTTDKRPYVAMRLIQGESLKSLIEREKRVDVDRAWHLLRQVCVALQSAHEAGIVHRDLKPENLMVEARDSGEFVTILDFGIAKVEAETEQRLTQDGQVIGTPGYMAPEQALGRAVDGRADQYSIGAIFYELVSGGFPYDRLGALQTITQQITQQARPISALVDEQAVPPALQALIMKALSRETSDRLHSLEAFVREVDEALGFVPPVPARTRLTLEAAAASPAAPTPSTRSGAGRWVPVLGGAVAVGAAVAAFLAMGGKPDSPPETFAVAAPASQPPAPPSSAAVATAAPSAVAPPSVASAPPTAPASVVGTAPPAVAASVAAAPASRPNPRAGAAPVSVAAAAPASEPPAPTPPTSPPAPVTAAPPTAVAAPPSLAPTAPPPAAPAGPPRLVVDALKIVGGASAGDIKRRMATAEATIRACVARDASLKAGAQAVVKVTIDGDGFFGEPEVSGDPGLGRCAIAAVKGARLDRRPDTGDIRVTVPLRLEAP